MMFHTGLKRYETADVNHSFDEDAISAISNVDRNVYMLHGTTHQMEHNPVFYAMWLNGMIYVDRLVAPLFSSPYLLNKALEIEVVSFITFHDFGTNEIWIRAGGPMALWQYEKQEALNRLRDAMSTIVYEIMEEHVKPICRRELGENPRLDYMETRKSVYACQTWYEDVWDEEMTYYPGHGVTLPAKAREYVDHIRVTPQNAGILAEVLCRREEDKRYDLKRYMRDTFLLAPLMLDSA